MTPDEELQFRLHQAVMRLNAGVQGAGESDLRTIAKCIRAGGRLEEFGYQLLADLLDPDGISPGTSQMKRRQKGAPMNTLKILERVRIEAEAYRIVNKAPRGEREAAVMEAQENTGLTRAEVYATIKKYQAAEAKKETPRK